MESCSACGLNNEEEVNFCRKCGAPILITQKKTLAEKKAKHEKLSLVKPVSFYLATLSFIFFLSTYSFHSKLFGEVVADSGIITITIAFALYERKRIFALLRWKQLNLKVLLWVIPVSLLFALLVHVWVNFLNLHLYEEYVTERYSAFHNTPFPLFFTIISTAVVPAVFEEVGFRGIIYNNLIRLFDYRSVIIITALLFSVLHLSPISLIWMIFSGLYLTTLRYKFKTLWYSIIAHFIHNATMVVIYFYF